VRQGDPHHPPRHRSLYPGDIDLTSFTYRLVLSCPTPTMDTPTLYHRTYDTVIYTFFPLAVIRPRVSFFLLFSTLSRRCFCTPTLHPHLTYFSIPLTYFCGHLLDINKIILSYLTDRLGPPHLHDHSLIPSVLKSSISLHASDQVCPCHLGLNTLLKNGMLRNVART
jgi:hypothetical protein